MYWFTCANAVTMSGDTVTVADCDYVVGDGTAVYSGGTLVFASYTSGPDSGFPPDGAVRATFRHSEPLSKNISGKTFEAALAKVNARATTTFTDARYKWYAEGTAGQVVTGDPFVTKIVAWSNLPADSTPYNTRTEGWVAKTDIGWVGSYEDDVFAITPV